MNISRQHIVIVLPTYNEAQNIEAMISKIIDVEIDRSKYDLSMLVVDSNSGDGTAAVVQKIQKSTPNLHLMQTEKEGLGRAYIRGFRHAIAELNASILVQMDSDLSHDPYKLPEFIAQIEHGADYVVGSRYTKGGSIPSDWALHRKIFSVFGNLIIRFGFMNLKVTDWTTGYRMVKASIINDIIDNISDYSGYVFQVAMLDNAVKHHAVIREVPINFIDRREGVSKINSVEYMFQTLRYVFLKSSFVKFVIVGGSGFFLDFLVSFIFIDIFHFRVWLATMISVQTALISNFLLNNFWSFSHKQLEKRKRTYFKGFVKFNLVGMGSLIIQSVSMEVFTRIFGRELWFVYKLFVILLLIIPYSYFSYNKFIWKEKKPAVA